MTGRQLEEDLGDIWAGFEENFAWGTGAALQGFNAYRTEGGWMLVLKVNSVQRGALVAFYSAQTMADVMSNLMYDLNHNPGITWKKDKYAKSVT